MNTLHKNYQIVQSAYPEIASRIKLFWGQRDFTVLMLELVGATRGDSLDGFPKNIKEAILELQAIHDKTFPSYSVQARNDRSLAHRSF